MWRGSIMRCILRGRRSIWWGSRLTLLAPRILNDVSYVRRINHEIHFAWQAQYLVKVEGDYCCSAHSKWRFICETRINHGIHFAWQAQYLVKLDCESCCSAHCKWRFICDADQSSQSFCVAGAVFGEVGGWLLLLRALYVTFHMRRTSIM